MQTGERLYRKIGKNAMQVNCTDFKARLKRSLWTHFHKYLASLCCLVYFHNKLDKTCTLELHKILMSIYISTFIEVWKNIDSTLIFQLYIIQLDIKVLQFNADRMQTWFLSHSLVFYPRNWKCIVKSFVLKYLKVLMSSMSRAFFS